MTWRQEINDRLRDLLISNQKLSYSGITRTINEQFGTTFTRNAIIGRASRTGLTNKQGPRNPATPRPPRTPTVTITPPTSDLHRGLMDLADDACKWPVEGDMYCGGMALRRRSYCAFHTELGRRKS